MYISKICFEHIEENNFDGLVYRISMISDTGPLKYYLGLYIWCLKRDQFHQ